jgi:hypothetical protein
MSRRVAWAALLVGLLAPIAAGAQTRAHFLVGFMAGSTSRYQSPLNSSGLIAMNNAIISPTTNPMIVPAASIFFSLVVISTS